MLRTLKSLNTYISEGIEDLLKSSEMEYHTSEDWREKKPKDFIVVIDDREVSLEIDDLYKNIENFIRSSSSKLFLVGKIDDNDDATITITKTELRKLAVNPYDPVKISLMYNGDAIETTLLAEDTVSEGYLYEKHGNGKKDKKKSPNPGTPNPGTPNPGTPDPGTPDSGTLGPGGNPTPEEEIKRVQTEMEDIQGQIASGVDKDGNPLTSEQKAEIQRSLESKEDSIYNKLVEKYKQDHPNATPEEIAAGVKESNPSFGSLIDKVGKRKEEKGKKENKTGEEKDTTGGRGDDEGYSRGSSDNSWNKGDKDKGKRGNDKGGNYPLSPEKALENTMSVINGAMKGEGSALAVAFGLMSFITVAGYRIASDKIEKHKETKEALEERLADARRSFSSATEDSYKDDPMNASTMSLFYDQDGNPRDSDELKKTFGDIDPNTMSRYIEVAEKYAKSPEFKDAQAYNEAISKLDPKDKAEIDAYSIDQAKLSMANSRLAQQNALIREMKKEISKVEQAGSSLDKSYLKALKHDLANKKNQKESLSKEIKTHQDAIDKRKDAMVRIANANKDIIPQLKEFQTNEMTPTALNIRIEQIKSKINGGVNDSGVPLTDEEKEALNRGLETAEDDITKKVVEVFKKDNPDFSGTEEEMMNKIKNNNKDNKVLSDAIKNSLGRKSPRGGGEPRGGEPGGTDDISRKKEEWDDINKQLKTGKDKDGNPLSDEQKGQLTRDADALQDEVIDTLKDGYKRGHPDASEGDVQKEIRKAHPDIVPKSDTVTKNGIKTLVQFKKGPRGGKYFRTKGPDSTHYSEWQSGDYKKNL